MEYANVNNMSNMFYGCGSLISLPDVSKWIINNANNMKWIFKECNSLISTPDISKWNTLISNKIFDGCINCLIQVEK